MDDFDDLTDTDDAAPPEEAGNRNFLIIAGVLGGVVILVVICIAVYFLMVQPRNAALREQQEATLSAQGTNVASIVNQTATSDAMAAIIAAYTATPTKTKIPDTSTPAPTATKLLADTTSIAGAPATITLLPGQATATALHATLTRNAVILGGTSTAVALASTQQLSQTGFADEIGLPALLGVSVLLIVVIFLARRLRTA